MYPGGRAGASSKTMSTTALSLLVDTAAISWRRVSEGYLLYCLGQGVRTSTPSPRTARTSRLYAPACFSKVSAQRRLPGLQWTESAELGPRMRAGDRLVLPSRPPGNVLLLVTDQMPVTAFLPSREGTKLIGRSPRSRHSAGHSGTGHRPPPPSGRAAAPVWASDSKSRAVPKCPLLSAVVGSCPPEGTDGASVRSSLCLKLPRTWAFLRRGPQWAICPHAPAAFKRGLPVSGSSCQAGQTHRCFPSRLQRDIWSAYL